MADVPVKFKKGMKATMPSQIEEGTVYFTEDEGGLYVDVSESERIRIGEEWTVLYTAQALTEEHKTQARENIGAQSRLTGAMEQIVSFDENGDVITIDTAGGEEAVEFLAELNLIDQPAVDATNSILLDEENNILTI